ncbi:MAG: ABC transporter substrate-binding protein [Bacillota bacterium]|nr:ABC transporter substrate-binding protein [Bacillota bacterium]
MRKLKIITLFLILVFMLGLLLTGCGETEDERHILRVGFLREIESLNPMLIWSYQAYEIMYLNYNMLIGWDEDMNVVPNLASDWEVDDEGLTWTFYLQEGVTWHDGEPFSADDVKFTFEYIRDNELGYFYDYVAAMEEIEVIDENTLAITTDEPIAWMPQILVPIFPEHIWSEVDPEDAEGEYANDDPVGTGPFQVIEHRKGEFTRMAANPDYFKGAPALDEVIFIVYSNTDLMVEALKQGELDVITSVPGAQFKALEEAGDPNIVALAADSPSFSELSFNVWEDPESLGNPLLLDKNIRVAIEYAIDRQEIIDVGYLGYGEIGSTLVPPLFEFWHLDMGNDFRSYNPVTANQILDEAGYAMGADGIRVSPEGEPLSFTMLIRQESPDNQKAATLIKDMLEDVGISITISVIDEGTLTDRIFDSDFDMFIWGWFVDVDPTSILKVVTTDEIMSWSDCFYSNPVYDEMHLRQQRTMDWDERQAIIHEMQRIFYDDAAYIILSYDPELQAYRTDSYEGWIRNPRTGPVIFTNVVDTYEQLRPIE